MSRAEKIEALRAKHARGGKHRTGAVAAMTDAMVTARFGTSDAPIPPPVVTGADLSWMTGARLPGCAHTWIEYEDGTYLRCSKCKLFRTRALGKPPSTAKLPAILKSRPLPPYPEGAESHTLFGRSLITKSVLDVHDRLRIGQCWSTYGPEGLYHYEIEVRFRRGWCYVGTFSETRWHRIVEATEQFTLREPLDLFVAIQIALYGTARISSVVASLNAKERP